MRHTRSNWNPCNLCRRKISQEIDSKFSLSESLKESFAPNNFLYNQLFYCGEWRWNKSLSIACLSQRPSRGFQVPIVPGQRKSVNAPSELISMTNDFFCAICLYLKLTNSNINLTPKKYFIKWCVVTFYPPFALVSFLMAIRSNQLTILLYI